MILTSWDRFRDYGLLILRVVIGGFFAVVHGWPKISGGAEMWNQIGGAMANFGINFAPTFWGFSAACAEFFGGIFFALGFLFRPACFALLMTMIVAATHHLAGGDGIGVASHALKLAGVFFAMLFIGPGRFSIDDRFKK